MKLGKVIKLPIVVNGPPLPSFEMESIRTEEETLKIILQLLCDDFEAFLSLEANCMSWKPIKIGEKSKDKLRELELIDKNGYSPTVVCKIMRLIANYQRERSMM